MGNSYFPPEWLKQDPLVFQAHLKRISDFIMTGEWHLTTNNGGMLFFDGQNEPTEKTQVGIVYPYNILDTNSRGKMPAATRNLQLPSNCTVKRYFDLDLICQSSEIG